MKEETAIQMMTTVTMIAISFRRIEIHGGDRPQVGLNRHEAKLEK